MSVIEGSSVSVKTMSDGTLRLSIDIEPRNAQAAFALFGAPGRAIALAALKDGTGAVVDHALASTPVVDQKPKGGEWAKLAGIWCADPEFWKFCFEEHPSADSVTSPDEAADLVRYLCEIESRADLDHDKEALARFNKYFRHPFMKWMQARGIVR